MAYNTKEVKKDRDGNPISQYYNPTTDEYGVVEGSSGANKVIIWDKNGNESEQLNLRPILSILERLTGTVVDEETRKSNEGSRKSSESDRELAESTRQSQENTRQDNESQRELNESSRESAENIRESNESTRIDNMNIVEGWIANPEQFDGRDIEYTWRGTELGIRLVGNTEYEYVDLKGETGNIENLNARHIQEALGFIPADENVVNSHINTMVHNSEIHGFRLTEDKTLEFYDGFEWVEVRGGGTEVKVGNVLNLSVDEDDASVTIKWEDPGDVIVDVDGQSITFAEWTGTQLRYSMGNFPVDEDSGELLVDNTVKNKYKDTGFKHVGLTNDVEGYYMLFPYTKDEAFTVDSANRIKATPGEIDPNSWSGIQKIVRKGITNEFFAVGDQIMANYDGAETVFEVIGIDVDTPSDPQYTHSMTLQTKDCLHNIQFDSKEPSNSNAGRIEYGNNRYIHNAVKQWLNSDEPKFVWRSQHSDDAKPDDSLDIYNGAGFLNRLDSELSAVLGAVDKKVAKADVDGGGQDTYSDKVFLLSELEVSGSGQGDTTGEVVYPFYDGVADAARIKNLNGSPTYWWLSSPSVSHSDYVRGVSTSGSVNISSARSTRGVAPACVII